MSKKCTICGAELEDAAVFCPECGASAMTKEPDAAPVAATGAFSLESLLKRKQQEYADEQKRLIEEDRKRQEEEDRRKAEEQARREEEERLRREEEKKRKAEESRRKAEEKARMEEEARLKRAEEEKRKAEEELRKAEEKARAKAKREEAKKKEEAEEKKEERIRKRATKTLMEDGLPYVDLGLSVKWAKCNLGASSPEGTGDHYAWGEIKPKSDYSWKTYQFGHEAPFSKYQPKTEVVVKHFLRASERVIKGDDKTVLEKMDDAASVQLGGDWRIPTLKEVRELILNCTWTTAYYKGVKGFKVTSNKKGYTYNWIFLPHCGSNGIHTHYGTSSQGKEDPKFAAVLSITKVWAWEGDVVCDELSASYITRCAGVVVRPVMK